MNQTAGPASRPFYPEGDKQMNLLITGAWADARAQTEAIAALGHSTAFLQQEKDPLPCSPAWVEGVVCNGLFLYHDLDSFPNLRLIQLTSAGLDRVPVDRVRARGIVLYNARGVYSAPMAEFAVCGVLQLYKQAARLRENQRKGRWEKQRDLRELLGKTVTVLGCGSVGTECARRFAAFGCRVIGVDLFPRREEGYHRILSLTELDALLPETDVLLLTLPLTAETRGLINRTRLAALKPGAVLVNISRGGVLEEAALVRALEEGTLSGAVLDVFDVEPLPESSPLWAMEQVILTPHNSFVGDGNRQRLTALILQHLGEETPGA